MKGKWGSSAKNVNNQDDRSVSAMSNNVSNGRIGQQWGLLAGTLSNRSVVGPSHPMHSKILDYSIDNDNDGFAKWLAYQLGLQMMWTHI